MTEHPLEEGVLGVEPSEDSTYYIVIIEQYLDEDIWQQLLLTFARGSYEDMWHALFTACDLFHRTAKFVEEQLSFTYKSEEEDNVRGFLQFVYKMSFLPFIPILGLVLNMFNIHPVIVLSYMFVSAAIISSFCFLLRHSI